MALTTPPSLVSLIAEMQTMIGLAAEHGDTLGCDMLHGRIAEVEAVAAMIAGEDEALQQLRADYPLA